MKKIHTSLSFYKFWKECILLNLMQHYKNYTIDYFSILLIPQSYELHKHVNTEEKFWCTYKIYFLHIYQIEISMVGLHCLLLRKMRRRERVFKMFLPWLNS